MRRRGCRRSGLALPSNIYPAPARFRLLWSPFVRDLEPAPRQRVKRPADMIQRAPRGHASQARTCLSSCSSEPHPLRSRGLRRTRGGSIPASASSNGPAGRKTGPFLLCGRRRFAGVCWPVQISLVTQYASCGRPCASLARPPTSWTGRASRSPKAAYPTSQR